MKNKTVFVIGSGSTAYLDIPTSKQQNKLIYNLKDSGDDLLVRLSKILDGTFNENNYTVNDIYNIIDSNLILHNALRYEKDTGLTHVPFLCDGRLRAAEPHGNGCRAQVSGHPRGPFGNIPRLCAQGGDRPPDR